jgi:GMP synthase (glutamine-hydrolysing)
MSKPIAVAIRHISFEDLGSFTAPIEEAGYRVEYLDVGLHDLSNFDSAKPDLLVVLGGPIGVYEDAYYPLLTDEIRILGERLSTGRPILGICLGAQLIAKPLGAKVYPGPGKEIGWAPIQLSSIGRKSALRHLDDGPAFHWHGDTFDLPVNCDLLASTEVCRAPGSVAAISPMVRSPIELSMVIVLFLSILDMTLADRGLVDSRYSGSSSSTALI